MTNVKTKTKEEKIKKKLRGLIPRAWKTYTLRYGSLLYF
jgi:hypothetical protein